MLVIHSCSSSSVVGGWPKSSWCSCSFPPLFSPLCTGVRSTPSIVRTMGSARIPSAITTTRFVFMNTQECVLGLLGTASQSTTRYACCSWHSAWNVDHLSPSVFSAAWCAATLATPFVCLQWCVGAQADPNFKTWDAITKELGHQHRTLDVFKVCGVLSSVSVFACSCFVFDLACLTCQQLSPCGLVVDSCTVQQPSIVCVCSVCWAQVDIEGHEPGVLAELRHDTPLPRQIVIEVSQKEGFF